MFILTLAIFMILSDGNHISRALSVQIKPKEHDQHYLGLPTHTHNTHEHRTSKLSPGLYFTVWGMLGGYWLQVCCNHKPCWNRTKALACLLAIIICQMITGFVSTSVDRVLGLTLDQFLCRKLAWWFRLLTGLCPLYYLFWQSLNCW